MRWGGSYSPLTPPVHKCLWRIPFEKWTVHPFSENPSGLSPLVTQRPSMHRRSTPGRVLGTQGEPNTEVGVGSEDSASRGREPSTSHQEPQPLGPLRPLPSPPPRSEALALSGVSETFFPPEASFSIQRRGFQVCYVMTISPLGGHYCNRDGPRQTLP